MVVVSIVGTTSRPTTASTTTGALSTGLSRSISFVGSLFT